jgi:hypothetical protein
LIGVTLSYTIIVIAVVAVVIWAVNRRLPRAERGVLGADSTPGVVVNILGADVIGTNRPTA